MAFIDHKPQHPLDSDSVVLDPRKRAGGSTFLFLTVFLTFGVRFVLAGWNSYWLDELYSVEIYVLRHASLLDAIGHLADTSIHPPLYQGVLYIWMSLFGDGEVATRTLSNLAVTLGVVFAHRFALRAFGWPIANATALTLSLAYLVMYYGLETRSYGLTLMLSTISSLALLATLRTVTQGRQKGLLLWWTILLSVSNLALLLTHYYNFFFWGAQALFVGTSTMVMIPSGRRLRHLLAAIAVYSLQLVMFLVLWGGVLVESYERNTGRYEADAISNTPIQMLESVTERTFNFGPLGGAWAIIMAVVILVWWVLREHRRGERTHILRDSGIAYISVMSVLPPILAFAIFVAVGAERFNARYMLYLLPNVTMLVLMALKQIANATTASIDRRVHSVSSRLGGHTVAIIIILATLLVVPGAVRASRSVKDDWREYAQEMAAISDSNPVADYAVLEPAFRSTPVFDYYLRRYSRDLRVTVTLRRNEERRGENFAFEGLEDELALKDYIMIPFVHHRTTNFPIALAKLEDTYSVHHRAINEDGKGLLILSVED